MLKNNRKINRKIFLLLVLVISSNVVRAMSGEIIVVSINDIEKKEAQRNFYYPDVQAAQNNSWGCAIADIYFAQQLSTKKIANLIPFKDACKYWRFGGNLPHAGKVIPELKEFTREVMTRAFALRRTALQALYVDQELFDALKEINTRICENPVQLQKWQVLKPHIEEFSKEHTESRQGYLGHDV